MYDFSLDPRFRGVEPLDEKVWLSSPTMHGRELEYMAEAYHTNWMSTVGKNIDCLESIIADVVGVKCAVALSSGTAALHLAVKLAAEKLYGSSSGISTPAGIGHGGSMLGRRAFCSDMTFAATVNPLVYEGGEPVFIDSEYDTWNMDPDALEVAFQIYPDVRLILMAHLYGTPGKIDEIRQIADRHNAILIEDAAESFGARYKKIQTGSFGYCGCISFNGNKIITGSSGGMFLTDNQQDADKIRKWSTQSREKAPWYQHAEVGYNYRMSNVIAGITRGQSAYLDKHIETKRQIYETYQEGLKDLPGSMNPFDIEKSEPNYWLSCYIIDKDAMTLQVRGEENTAWISERGKSCPTEILEAFSYYHVEGRPIWKPMHMQPLYQNHAFITAEGSGRAKSNAYIEEGNRMDVGADIFHRGLCLPSDIKMTIEQQKRIIDIVYRCFG